MASFGKAFSSARKAGQKEFTWKGKKFNTRVAGETPSRGPTPSAAPRASSGASRSTGNKTSASSASSVPTPSPRPSSKGSTMRSPRAVEGGKGMYSSAPKVAKRSSGGNSLAGGSILGGLVKWGDKASKKVQTPYRSSRGR